jgi:hypothetical protein
VILARDHDVVVTGLVFCWGLWRDRGREASQQGQGLHLYRGGTVAERFLEKQSYAAVGGDLQSFVGDGRTKFSPGILPGRCSSLDATFP